MTTELRSIPSALALCALALGAMAMPAAAQDDGDAARGLVYTRANCAQCHAVDGRQKDQPPVLGIATFEEIANAPGMTARALAVWFQSPHPRMPNLVLERKDRDDVIAYITSLRKKQ